MSSTEPISDNEDGDGDNAGESGKKTGSKKRALDSDDDVLEMVGSCIKFLVAQQQEGAKRDEEQAKREEHRLQLEIEREEKHIKLETDRSERERAKEERKTSEAKWAEYERASKFTSAAMIAYAACLEMELIGE